MGCLVIQLDTPGGAVNTTLEIVELDYEDDDDDRGGAPRDR